MTNRHVRIFKSNFCKSQWYSKVKLWRRFSILWLSMSVFEGVFLPFLIPKCYSHHIQIVFIQEYVFSNSKYLFDKWRWCKLTFWRNKLMHWRIILKVHSCAQTWYLSILKCDSRVVVHSSIWTLCIPKCAYGAHNACFTLKHFDLGNHRNMYLHNARASTDMTLLTCT